MYVYVTFLGEQTVRLAHWQYQLMVAAKDHRLLGAMVSLVGSGSPFSKIPLNAPTWSRGHDNRYGIARELFGEAA